MKFHNNQHGLQHWIYLKLIHFYSINLWNEAYCFFLNLSVYHIVMYHAFWVESTATYHGIYQNRCISQSKQQNSSCSHCAVTGQWWCGDYPLTYYSGTMEGYKTVYLCHIDSYTVTECNGFLVSSHVVTVQLPTRCLVDRFLHRPHGSGYLITCVSHVAAVQ